MKIVKTGDKVGLSHLQNGNLGNPTCSVAVISNPLVCSVCVFHAKVFSEIKLFAMKSIAMCSFHRKFLKVVQFFEFELPG